MLNISKISILMEIATRSGHINHTYNYQGFIQDMKLGWDNAIDGWMIHYANTYYNYIRFHTGCKLSMGEMSECDG